MTFADKLRAFRRAKGMSQKQFADKIGVYDNTICKWEIGDHIPLRQSEKKIKDAFPDWIWTPRAERKRPGPKPRQAAIKKSVPSSHDILMTTIKKRYEEKVRRLGNSDNPVDRKLYEMYRGINA